MKGFKPPLRSSARRAEAMDPEIQMERWECELYDEIEEVAKGHSLLFSFIEQEHDRLCRFIRRTIRSRRQR